MDDVKIYKVDVDGLLYFVLRIMAFIGIVPLRFQKCGSMHFIHLSPSFTWSGPLIITALCTCIIVGLVWDFCIEDRSQAIHITTVESSLFWTMSSIILCATSLVGIFGAPDRIRKCIIIVGYIKKANLQMTRGIKPRQKEYLSMTLLMMYSLFIIIGILFNFAVYRDEAIRKHSKMSICYLYSCCYPLYILNYLVLVQLSLILRIVNNSHQMLNETLGSTIENLENAILSRAFVHKPKIIPSWKMINKATDQSADLETEENAVVPSIISEKQLRKILLHYVRLSEIKDLINNHEGIMAFLSYITFLCNIINLAFDLISIIRYKAYSVTKVFFIINYCFWIVMYLTNFITVIHLCQQTEAQIERTKALVSRMFHVTSSNGLLLRNLDFLFYVLQTLNPQYSPLGLFTTTRSLIFTVLNSTLSYVIVFIQFRFNTSF